MAGNMENQNIKILLSKSCSLHNRKTNMNKNYKRHFNGTQISRF